MEEPEHHRKDKAFKTKYHNPPPVTVPRSQYANTVRSGTHRSNVSNPGPTYFSSPLRAPLNQQERHDSLIAHQRLFSTKADNDRAAHQARHPPAAYKPSTSTSEPRYAATYTYPTQRPPQNYSSNNTANDSLGSSQDQNELVRQASIGHKAKPLLLKLKQSDSTRTRQMEAEAKTPPLQDRTIEALNAAIVAASQVVTQESGRPQPARNSSDLFGGPDSPTSTYSQDMYNQRRSRARSSQAVGSSSRMSSSRRELQTPALTTHDKRSPSQGPTPRSEKSSNSTNPLLGLGIDHHGMSSRIPEEMRPPPLDINAVRDMESRGSITSLPDLIRRATRLAANLDRGKTASRLGFWDMFGNADHRDQKLRDSSFSDVLDAFPDPASGTPSKGVRPKSEWPTDFKDNVNVVEKQEPEPEGKASRKCCGLSMTWFLIILIIAILLIAAAILVPIFLIAVPRQHQGINLRACASTKPCRNHGVSIVDNNACSCICVDGFTGNDCSQATDPGCATATIVDGSSTFENATLGNSIVYLLQQAEKMMNIPLNATVVLSVFSSNNLSCASENSLVQFDTNTGRKLPRLVMIDSLDPTEPVVPDPLMSVQEPQVFPTKRSAILAARQTSVATVNNIVYQATSTQASSVAVASGSISATASTTLSSATGSPTGTGNITSYQVEFAQLVVLYVLAGSRVPSTAVLAQQNIEQYFRAGALASGNTTVDIVTMGNVSITANFADLAIVESNGKIIGGTHLDG